MLVVQSKATQALTIVGFICTSFDISVAIYPVYMAYLASGVLEFISNFKTVDVVLIWLHFNLPFPTQKWSTAIAVLFWDRKCVGLWGMKLLADL